MSASLLALALLASPAHARAPRVGQIPNGDVFGCLTCHLRDKAGGPLNTFGTQVEQTLIGDGSLATVDWSAVAPLDADRDGLTNGEELGDPDGDGRPGDGPVSHPADPNDPGPDDTGPADTGDLTPAPSRGCDTGDGAPLGALGLSIAALAARRRRGRDC